MGEYDHLFYKFEKLDTYGNEMFPPVQAYFRGESCIPGSHIYLPYRAYMNPGVISSEPHFHRDEEYLAFVGADLRDAYDSFDAEIEFWMGESRDDMEKIVITSPTMIRVPNFYWHGPIVIKRLGKPLFFQPVLFNCRYHAIKRKETPDGKEYFETIAEGRSPCKLDPNAVCNFCGKCHGKDAAKDSTLIIPEESGTKTGKYDHLIHTFAREQTFWGDLYAPFQVYFRGHDCMPDSNFYSPYRTYMKEAFIDRWPNFHTEDEFLCFIGYDMTDPFGSFDAEIEFWIGEDRNHMEQHIFTEPTMIRIPAYMWHCPLQYRRVTKPVYLQVLQPRGKFGAFSPMKDSEGNKFIVYAGSNGAKKCNLDKNKQCTFCGRCMRPSPNEPKTAAETIARIAAGE